VARPARALRGGSGRTRRGRAGACGRGVGKRCAAGSERVGVRASGRARARYLFGPAAPCSVTRQCRVKIGGTAEPCHVTGHDSGHRHVSPLPRHHAWRGIGIWPRQGNRRVKKC